MDDNINRSAYNKSKSPGIRKPSKPGDITSNLEASMIGAEGEIQRLNDKCKSYQNEVTRISQIHEEEVTKLKKRIKTLETGIKRLDLLNNHCFTFIKEFHKQCIPRFIIQ